MTTTTHALGIFEDVEEASYHADPALSQSGAKLLLVSPAKYRWRMDNPEHRDAFDYGHAAHAKILGVGADVVTVHADDWRSKAAQEAKRKAHEAGKTPLLAKDVARIDAMALAIEAHPTAAAILHSAGRPELSMWWTEHTTDGTEVPARGRVDYATTTAAGDPVIVDLKTTVDASPAGFTKTVTNLGYDLQAAAYRRGWEALTGQRPAFVLIAQEKEAPYLVGVYTLDWTYDARGDDHWQQAIDLYARCAATDTWPGYSTGITELTPPRWV